MVDPRFCKKAKALTQAGYRVTFILWDIKGDYLEEEKIERIDIIRIHNTVLMKVLLNYLFQDPLWKR